MPILSPAADETQGPKYPAVVVTLSRREQRDAHAIRARVKTALHHARVDKHVFEGFASATTFDKAAGVIEKAGEIVTVILR